MRLIVAALLGLSACGGSDKPDPERETLRQPSGLALSDDGRWLFVANGNWDQRESAGTLMIVDAARLFSRLAGPVGAPGAGLSFEQPCRRVAFDDDTIECDPTRFIDADHTVLLGSALGNLALDEEDGRLRLLLPQRRPSAIAWLDATPTSAGLIFDCGQDSDGRCGDDHFVDASSSDPDLDLPDDPSRVVLDEEFRFGYVPHLLGGTLSLLALDGDFGPELLAVEADFYATSQFEDFEQAGGFSVAQRGCDPTNPPRASRECTRPVFLSTHRFWPGVRAFSVIPGNGLLVPGNDTAISPVGTEMIATNPIMADLVFEDEARESLLIVQTTPASLARVATTVDEQGGLETELRTTVSLCENPNLVELFRPAGEEPLALVTCFGEGAVAVVALGTFQVLRVIQVGPGANELVVDHARRQLFVANSRENTISVVSLDRTSPRFLTEWARLGLGAPARELRDG